MPLRAESHIRISREPIATREPVHTADIVLVFGGPFGDVAENGMVITAIAGERPKMKKRKVFSVDAGAIAAEYGLGIFHPAPVLGAFARAFGKLPLKAMKAQVPEKEQRALEAGFRKVK